VKAATLTVKRMALADLRPHKSNPRIHPDPGTPAWEALRRSLEHDYIDPLGINSGKACKKLKNVLWSGHLRLKVLQEMGVKSADVVVKDYTEKEHLARMIAANRQVGEDDETALANLLRGMDGETLLTGMGEDDISALLSRLEPEQVPVDNTPIDEEAMLKTEHECPKCGFKW
jgi:ParB-like chromosome segregation protein Spo0J